MKYLFFTFLFSISTLFLHAAAGIFDSFAILNVNAGGNGFFDLGATTGNPDFEGTSIGFFDPSTQSLILGGQTKTFKNNGTDVTGASIFYRIYPLGAPSGTFTEIPYAFQIDDVGGTVGDQQWGTDVNGANATDTGVEILSGTGLVAGDYTLEVYVRITTNGTNADPEIFDNNNGSNYTATFTVSSTLPVELLVFSAKNNGKEIILNWETASELNNSYFGVERSFNAKEWRSIDKVQGNGTTLDKKSYKYIDRDAFDGKNYYRLKQVDYNGNYEFSKVITVMSYQKKAEGIKIYPTIVENELTIENGIGKAQLYNFSGQLVGTFQIPEERFILDVSNLPNGRYTLSIFGANKNTTSISFVK